MGREERVAATLRAGGRGAGKGRGRNNSPFPPFVYPAWVVVRDFRTLAALAGVLCDVWGLIGLFSGGAFRGDARAVPGAFGLELVGIAGEVSALIGALIGVVPEALVVGGLGYEAVKAWAVIAEGLGFGLPAAGGVHLLEHLDPDGEAFGGGHEE